MLVLLYDVLYVYTVLFFLVPPTIVQPLMNVTVLQNSNVSFTCVLNSSPAPLVQWYFISSNGSSQLITSGGQYTVSNLFSSGNYNYIATLFISSVTFQNTGNYQCTGSNSVGDPSTSLSTLTVFGKIYCDKDIQ